MRFHHGKPEAPLKLVGPAPEGKKGTKVSFLPSSETFKITEFDFDTLEHRFRELAFLNSGVRLILTDARHEEEKSVELFYEGGISAFVRWLDRAKAPLIPEPISVTGQRDDVGIEVALEWNDSYYEQVLCFNQQHPQRDGGTHLPLPHGLTRTINSHADRSGMMKREKVSLTATICARPDRDRLGQAADPNSRARPRTNCQFRGAPAAREPDGRQARRMARGESRHTRTIIQRSSTPPPRARPPARQGGQPQERARHLLAARQARRLPGARSGQVGIVPCRGRQRRRLAKQGRDRHFQAILPLAADPHVEARPLRSELSSREVGTLIQAWAPASAATIRHRETALPQIVIMTDADVDGAISAPCC